MTMTDAEIADLLANATPGPWPRAQYCIVVPSPEFSDGEIVCWAAKDLPFCDNELIAMAPTLARLALDRGKEIERLRAADRAEARTTLPDDLRRQVLAAVHNAQRACERILAAFEHSTPREDLAYSVGVVAMRSAILAEFGLNPDGTMKESPDD